MQENIINYFHLVFLIFMMTSPFIKDCALKMNAFILFAFIIFHYISKYGKCGIINIEKFFLKENFKNGFFYKFIKPIISYKDNIFYYKLFHILILYFIILLLQIYNENCLKKIYNDLTFLIKYYIV
jgi:hypothetical protein